MDMEKGKELKVQIDLNMFRVNIIFMIILVIILIEGHMLILLETVLRIMLVLMLILLIGLVMLDMLGMFMLVVRLEQIKTQVLKN